MKQSDNDNVRKGKIQITMRLYFVNRHLAIFFYLKHYSVAHIADYNPGCVTKSNSVTLAQDTESNGFTLHRVLTADARKSILVSFCFAWID